MTPATVPRHRRPPGWVLVDHECGICRRLARRLRATLHRLGYRLAPLATARRAGVLGEPERDEMVVITRRRHLRRGGADGIIALMREHPLTRPATVAAEIPCLRYAARRAYAWFAALRHRFGCRLERSRP